MRSVVGWSSTENSGILKLLHLAIRYIIIIYLLMIDYMATVFFKVTNQQDVEIKTLMEQEGYTNKAEFFRFLLKFFKYHKTPEELRLEKASKDLAAVLAKLDKQGKLDSSLDEQLDDV